MEALHELLPWALLVLSLLLAVSAGPRVYRSARAFFSYPAYGLHPVCPHCVQPLLYTPAHFCPACDLPVDGFAATDPVLRIASMGAVYRRAASRAHGLGLAGLLVLVGVPVGASIGVALDPNSVGATAVLAGALPWLLILSKRLGTSGEPRRGRGV
jgi:hypothetical protein